MTNERAKKVFKHMKQGSKYMDPQKILETFYLLERISFMID